jgi:uncharacterized membrane protein
LGLYTNALFDYSHFQWNDSSTFKIDEQNLLADHFDLYLILFSPFSFILGTYTLQFIQIIALLLGALGVYQFGKSFFKNQQLVWLATLHFLLFFGCFAAVAFDYHSNVVAACVLPWFFFAIQKSKLKWIISLFIFMLIAKENMAIWLFFICIGCAWQYRKNQIILNILLILSLFSVIYFYEISQKIMPALSHLGSFEQLKYSVLGKNISEIIWFFISHPFDAIELLFKSHSSLDLAKNVKAEFHWFVLLSGLWLLIYRPIYIWMLLPIYFQKMYHDNYFIWGIAGQYSIEFAPILAIGTFAVIDQVNNQKWIKFLSVLNILLCLSITFRSMDKTILFTDKTRIRFYQSAHYKKDYDVKKVHNALSLIPRQAVVSAQSPYLPHLALRDRIYQFPIIKDAQYVVFSKQEVTYPLSSSDFNKTCDSILALPNYTLLYKGEIKILKRKN